MTARVDDHQAHRVITLDNGRQNLLDVSTLRALRQAVEDAPPHQAVVITGQGAVFSAGLDVVAVAEMNDREIHALLDALEEAVLAIFLHAGPTVAAVNGHAVAGGLLVAMAADRRMASAGMAGLTELAVGVALPPALVEVARFAAGHRLADLLYAATLLPMADLAEVGVINRMVTEADVVESAVAETLRLAAMPAAAFQATKSALKSPATARVRNVDHADTIAAQSTWTSPAARRSISQFASRLGRAGRSH